MTLDKTKTLRQQLSVSTLRENTSRVIQGSRTARLQGVIFRTEVNGIAISLTRQATKYTVAYGRIVHANMDADTAGAELGAAIIFALTRRQLK